MLPEEPRNALSAVAFNFGEFFSLSAELPGL